MCLLASLLLLALSTMSPQVNAERQVPFRTFSHTQDYEFDPLLHLPGISPYFDAVGSGLNHAAPIDCEVTAASYLIRHAAIYANDKDYEDYINPFLMKLNGTTSGDWIGPLSLFNNWQNPISDPENQLENITPQGARDSEKVGKHLLSRYPKLVPTTKHIYADKKSRTQDTAKALSKAFPQPVDIHIIGPNTPHSFHAQIPHKSCRAFSKEPGDKELAEFISFYTPSIVERLQEYSPVQLANNDIVGLQQLCGYESAITGKVSKICNVFTDSEWLAYEYAWDLKYSMMVGHGNPLSMYLGFPWLNVTAELFSKFHAPIHEPGEEGEAKVEAEVPDDDGQRFFLSFTHREVPPFIATALGLFNSSNSAAEEFPNNRVNWSRAWKMAELIPFLGHVGIEKLSCRRPLGPTSASAKDPLREYIRIIANSSPRPIPLCQSGPGASCPFDRFEEIVAAGMRTYGDFEAVCGI